MSGCAASHKLLNVQTEEIRIARVEYPRPSSLTAPVIKMRVAKTTGDTSVIIYGMTEKDYRKFGTFLIDVEEYIKSLNAVIDSYVRDVRRYNAEEDGR